MRSSCFFQINNYLNKVQSHLYLSHEKELQLINELGSHLEQKLNDLKKEGLSEKDAVDKTIESFGKPSTLARLLYEAYSRGSWLEALMLSLPHFIVATLFAFHIIYIPFVAFLVFTMVVIITLNGWRGGKPDWLYSWIGYALMPLFAAGLALWPILSQFFAALMVGSAMPSSWLVLSAFVYFCFVIWFIVWISIRVIRRDWLLASLMLVPIPIIGCWLFLVQESGGLFSTNGVYHRDIFITLVLVMLGITTVIFTRLRQRILKGGAIITISTISFIMVGLSLWGEIGFFGLLSLSFFMLMVLFIPALIQQIIGHGEYDSNKFFPVEYSRNSPPI
jgi:hypothetical protein